MNRLTVLVDIASRVMHATAGSPRTVAGAVAVDTAALCELRHELKGLRKWGKADDDHIVHVVDILKSQAIAVAIVSINRDTSAWRQFLIDAECLHDAIVKDSRQVARWASASNLLKFILLSSACAAATGHAVGMDKRPKVLSARGLQLIECQTICDNEVEGPENIEVFKSFWGEQHIPRKQLERCGIEMASTSVALTTDHADSALLLADYAAGLGLAYTLEAQGSLPLPIAKQRAGELLNALNANGKVVVVPEDFDHAYDQIFGHVMDTARELASK